MRIQTALLFLVLIAVTSLSYAEYVETDDGRLRFYRGGQEMNDFHIEMRDVDEGWQWIHSYHMPYLGKVKAVWKQPPESDGLVRTYIEHPNCFERHCPTPERHLVMVETKDERFRIYPSGYDLEFNPYNRPQYEIKFDVYKQDSGRFETLTKKDIRSYYSFNLGLSSSGELLLKLLPYVGEWIPELLLSADDVESFKK